MRTQPTSARANERARSVDASDVRARPRSHAPRQRRKLLEIAVGRDAVLGAQPLPAGRRCATTRPIDRSIDRSRTTITLRAGGGAPELKADWGQADTRHTHTRHNRAERSERLAERAIYVKPQQTDAKPRAADFDCHIDRPECCARRFERHAAQAAHSATRTCTRARALAPKRETNRRGTRAVHAASRRERIERATDLRTRSSRETPPANARVQCRSQRLNGPRRARRRARRRRRATARRRARTALSQNCGICASCS